MTVAPFVTAHAFYASWNRTKTRVHRFVRVDYDCAGKGYLSKGYWNSEGKFGVGKNSIHS